MGPVGYAAKRRHLERYSDRFFGIPLVERVMLAMRNEADALYRKLTEPRSDDRELAVSHLSNIAMKANLERRHLKPDDAAKTLDRAEALLQTLLGRTPGDRALLLVQVNHGKVRLAVLTIPAGGSEAGSRAWQTCHHCARTGRALGRVPP